MVVIVRMMMINYDEPGVGAGSAGDGSAGAGSAGDGSAGDPQEATTSFARVSGSGGFAQSKWERGLCFAFFNAEL